MASIREIRKRIGGVRNTMQLTRAMKMVAAAKLRRSQDKVEGSRPYLEVLKHMIGSVSQTLGEGGEGLDQLALLKGPGEATIVLASDRGLCGSFNNNVLKQAQAVVSERPGMHFFVYGKRALEGFRRRAIEIKHGDPQIFSNFSWERSATAIEEIFQYCGTHNIGRLNAVYTKFQSAGRQSVVFETLYPIDLNDAVATEPATRSAGSVIIEPEPVRVLKQLIEHYSRFSFYHILLESLASEHAARMAAMDTASNNCKEMIDTLTLEMNRARQATITRELLEIIGGKEALES